MNNYQRSQNNDHIFISDLSFPGLTGESRKTLDARFRPAGMTGIQKRPCKKFQFNYGTFKKSCDSLDPLRLFPFRRYGYAPVGFIHGGHFDLLLGTQQFPVNGVVLPAVHMGCPPGSGFEPFPVGAAV